MGISGKDVALVCPLSAPVVGSMGISEIAMVRSIMSKMTPVNKQGAYILTSIMSKMTPKQGAYKVYHAQNDARE